MQNGKSAARGTSLPRGHPMPPCRNPAPARSACASVPLLSLVAVAIVVVILAAAAAAATAAFAVGRRPLSRARVPPWQLTDALEALGVKTTENQSLLEQVRELVTASIKVSAGGGAAGAAIVEGLVNDRQKARTEVEAANKAAAEATATAARLKEQLEAGQASVAAAEGLKAALHAEAATARGEIAAVRAEAHEAASVASTRLTTLGTELSQLEVVAEDAKAACGAAGGDVVVELTAELRAARKEIADTQGTLASALANLHVSMDENLSLGEQVEQLAANYEAARLERDELRAGSLDMAAAAQAREAAAAEAAARPTDRQRQVTETMHALGCLVVDVGPFIRSLSNFREGNFHTGSHVYVPPVMVRG